ncbi:MAG: hypothetical protein KDB22_07245, partial [Planctomycetales bacterium]|nr:hypothetical protein [Planctomycetales bacterium]
SFYSLTAYPRATICHCSAVPEDNSQVDCACRAESDVRSEEFRESETTVRDKTLPRLNYQFHPL